MRWQAISGIELERERWLGLLFRAIREFAISVAPLMAAAWATWESVGGSVGVSRQAAWERFHKDVQDLRQRVKADARALRDRHRQEWDEFEENVRSQAKTHHRRSH